MTRNKIIAGLFLLTLLIALPITIFLASDKNLNDNRSRANLSGTTEESTNIIIQDSSTDSEIISKSVERKTKMLELARSNPEEFLLNIIPDEIRNDLPSAAQDNIEKKIEISGFLIGSVDDEKTENSSGFESMTLQTIDSEGETKESYELIILNDLEDLEGNVKVSGYLLDNIIIPVTVEKINSTGNTKVLGAANPKKLKIAVVMVNFKNDLSDTKGQFTKEILNNIYFSGNESVANYLDKTSLNSLDATGNINDIYGWITLDSYNRKQVCDIYERKTSNKGFIKAINMKAKAQARQRGKDFSDYDVIGYVFAPTLKNESKNSDGTNCYWNAISKGIPGDSVVSSIHFLNGDYDGVNDVNHGNLDSDSSIKFYSGILAHEIGHNLGLSHAHGMVCNNKKQISKFDECYIYNYGDRFDLIGGAWDYKSHTNARNKNLLGWLPSSNVKTINNSTTVNIYSASSQKSNQIQLVKIPRSSGGNYYLEYKTKENGDNRAPSYIYDGAFLRLSDINLPRMKNERGGYQDEWRTKQSYLIDVDKSDNSGRGGLLNPTFKDNKVFEDSRNKIRIKQISHNNEFVRMEISILPSSCELEKPSLIISEYVKSGNPGTRTKYTFTIKNNNSSNCPVGKFNIRSIAPNGFTTTIPESNVSLRPNESKTIDIFITSSQTANSSSNPFKITITAQNSEKTNISTTKEVRYLVTGGINPTTTQSVTQQITPSPTKKPSITPKPSEIPLTPAPTVITQQGMTYLNLQIEATGIGNMGNKNPKKRHLELSIKIVKAGGNSEEDLKIKIPYSGTDGKFTDNIKLKNDFPDGTYNIFISSKGYLSQRVDMDIISKTVNNVGALKFSPGDINDDGKRNILDWDLIRYCSSYEKIQNRNLCEDGSDKMQNSDLNSSGEIDIDDINLWLKEYTTSN